MKALTPLERKVLSHVEFDPDATVAQVARRLNLKSSSVAYTLRCLEQRRAVVRCCFVDSCRLGYHDVGIFFATEDLDSERREAVIAAITAHDRVVWFGALAGDFQFGLILLVRNNADVRAFLEQMTAACGSFMASKSIVNRCRSTIFRRKHLGEPERIGRIFTFSTPGKNIHIDELDRRLLAALAQAPYDSLRHVARVTGAPVSTVERRIKNLATAGIYQGLYYHIQPRALGVTFFRILVSLKGIRGEERARISEMCSRHPNVTFLIESIGQWDFEVGYEIPDTSLLPDFLDGLRDLLPGQIKSINVLTEVKDYKFVTFPFKTENSDAAVAGMPAAVVRSTECSVCHSEVTKVV